MIPERYPSDLVADQYRLVERIGSGGFAEVWAAEHKATERKCALKILRAGHLANPLMRDRFQREGEILMKLDHPHIARAIDFAIEGGLAYIALELVQGITLGREIRARSRAQDFFTADAMHTILRPIAEALDYAHVHGVLHRDLKPGNVILTRDGVVRLLDFGIAKMLTAPTDMETTVGRLIGSKHYISPEQVRGQNVDARSDVFALGTVAFLMITHRMAWARDDQDRPVRYDAFRRSGMDDILSVIDRIIDAPRPRASEWREGLSLELDEVLARAMAVEPARRPASATAFVNELEEALTVSDAYTRIVDADAQIETVLKTQWVEDFMVIDDEVEPIEVLDLTPGVVRIDGITSLGGPARRPRWFAIALALVATGVLMAFAIVAVLGRDDTSQPVLIPTPGPNARETPSVSARPTPEPPPPAPPTVRPPEPRTSKPPPRARRNERTTSSPPPATAPKPRRKSTRLRRALKRLASDPSPTTIDEVRSIIVHQSKRLDNAAAQTAIERCAVGAAVVQNAKDLAACGRLLEAALGSGT